MPPVGAPARARDLQLRSIQMRIVLVSPNAAERGALQHLLVEEGHQVAAYATRAEALDAAAAELPDVLIADAQVVGLDGVALLRALAQRRLTPRVILLCPRASHSFEKDGIVCLTKPIDVAELHRWLGAGRRENRVA